MLNELAGLTNGKKANVPALCLNWRHIEMSITQPPRGNIPETQDAKCDVPTEVTAALRCFAILAWLYENPGHQGELVTK